MGGLDVVDYCGGCGGAVAPWVGEVCGCCGRAWGLDVQASGAAPRCRGAHVEGGAWRRLLDVVSV